MLVALLHCPTADSCTLMLCPVDYQLSVKLGSDLCCGTGQVTGHDAKAFMSLDMPQRRLGCQRQTHWLGDSCAGISSVLAKSISALER